MDKYTEHTLEFGISRRKFLSRAVVASCDAGLAGFSACKPDSPDRDAFDKDLKYGRSSGGEAFLSFLREPE